MAAQGSVMLVRREVVVKEVLLKGGSTYLLAKDLDIVSFYLHVKF